MAKIIRNTIKYHHLFDHASKRHYINGYQAVLHCHHFTTLYTQLALDAGKTDLLKDCARESISEVLELYFAENPHIQTINDKVDIACQYFALMGLGAMKVNFIGKYSGKVELFQSHIDSGWIKKWGIYDKPVNYIAAGFIEAMFETVLNLPARSFTAIETQSIVTGNETSEFKITRR